MVKHFAVNVPVFSNNENSSSEQGLDQSPATSAVEAPNGQKKSVGNSILPNNSQPINSMNLSQQPINQSSIPSDKTASASPSNLSSVSNESQASYVKRRQKAIEWLISIGLPPLPVAPAFLDRVGKDGRLRFNGKNPSYLDESGNPIQIDHLDYVDRMPTQEELSKFFVHPETGLGTVGGPGRPIVFDADKKDFDSEQEFEDWKQTFLERIGNAHCQATRSGGLRSFMMLEEIPDFTNWSDTPGGKKRGEVRGNKLFSVVAPTNGYKVIQHSDIVRVKSVADLGVYSTRSNTSSATTGQVEQRPQLKLIKSDKPAGNGLRLTDICSKKVQDLLRDTSQGEGRDRSDDVVKVARELYGWENWLQNNETVYIDSADQIVKDFAAAIGVESKLSRILSGIDKENCTPALVHSKGDEAAQKKVSSILRKCFPAAHQNSSEGSSTPEVEESPYRVSDEAQTPELHLNIHFFKEGKGSYRTIDRAFYRYSERGVWEHVPDCDMESIISTELKKLYASKMEKDGDGYKERKIYKFFSDRNIKSCFESNRKDLNVGSEERSSEHDRFYINFLNGVLDVRTGELLPHQKEMYLTSQIQANYVENCECPEAFKNFVKRCYGLNQLPYIRAIIRYYTDFSLPYGYFVHPIGESGTGKGVLIRFLGSIHGDYYGSSNEFHTLNSAEGRYQSLTGKRIYAFPDINHALGKMGAFYELVDNGKLSGRPLYSSSAPAKNWNIRFLVGSVGPIQFEKSSDGWDRRERPISTLPRGEADPDETIEPSLQDCKAEVISWAMAMDREECMRIIRNPSEFAVNHNSLKDAQAIASDSVKAFIDACLVPADNINKTVDKGTVHGWYKAFCEASKLSAKGLGKFSGELKAALGSQFEAGRTSTMQNGKKVNIPSKFQGIQPADIALFDIKTFPDKKDPTQERGEYICNVTYLSEGGLELFREVKAGRSKTTTTAPTQVEQPPAEQSPSPSPEPEKELDSHDYEPGQPVERLMSTGEFKNGFRYVGPKSKLEAWIQIQGCEPTAAPWSEIRHCQGAPSINVPEIEEDPGYPVGAIVVCTSAPLTSYYKKMKDTRFEIIEQGVDPKNVRIKPVKETPLKKGEYQPICPKTSLKVVATKAEESHSDNNPYGF